MKTELEIERRIRQMKVVHSDVDEKKDFPFTKKALEGGIDELEWVLE